ncbi:MAG: hypothetical protein RBU30_00880 [Polyangia bacterium]|nr:hypothetical protein [Polyangia bacterium]
MPPKSAEERSSTEVGASTMRAAVCPLPSPAAAWSVMLPPSWVVAPEDPPEAPVVAAPPRAAT